MFSRTSRLNKSLLFLEFSGFYILFSFQGSDTLSRFRFLWASSAEGGIWTLAPLLTTYSLSRGAPSATWVLLLMTLSIWNLSIKSGESGIRTHAPLRTNGFQDRLVMTTSISLQTCSAIISRCFSFVKNFFIFFEVFSFSKTSSPWNFLDAAPHFSQCFQGFLLSLSAATKGILSSLPP